MSKLAMEVRRIIADIDSWGRNAKVLVATEIFWTPSIWLLFYQTIFMREIGINEVFIGVSLTLTLIFQIFFPMLGGSLADKFGRKRVIMFSHIVGWTGYSGVLFLSREFWHILLAVIFRGLISTSNGVLQTYMFEDTEADRRASVVSFISIASIAAGLLTPIAGGLIYLYGVEMGCRYIFLTSVVSNAILFITRQVFLRESKIGKILSSDSKVSKNYVETLGTIREHSEIAMLFLLSILGSIAGNLIAFRPLYLTDPDTIALDESIVSIIPMAESVSSIIALTFIIPRINQRNIGKALLSSYAMGFLGVTILVLSPRGSLYSIILSVVLDSARYLAAFSILPIFLVNTIDQVNPYTKAKMMSLMTTFSALVSWPIPAFGGYLYTLNPSYPFLFAAISLSMCAGLLMLMKKTYVIED